MPRPHLRRRVHRPKIHRPRRHDRQIRISHHIIRHQVPHVLMPVRPHPALNMPGHAREVQLPPQQKVAAELPADCRGLGDDFGIRGEGVGEGDAEVAGDGVGVVGVGLLGRGEEGERGASEGGVDVSRDAGEPQVWGERERGVDAAVRGLEVDVVGLEAGWAGPAGDAAVLRRGEEEVLGTVWDGQLAGSSQTVRVQADSPQLCILPNLNSGQPPHIDLQHVRQRRVHRYNHIDRRARSLATK